MCTKCVLNNYQRLNITLPSPLITEIAGYQELFGLKRSQVIYLTLRDWIVRQPPLEKTPQARHEIMVGGKVFDPKKEFRYYLRDDMSADESWQVLQEFEAARKFK